MRCLHNCELIKGEMKFLNSMADIWLLFSLYLNSVNVVQHFNLLILSLEILLSITVVALKIIMDTVDWKPLFVLISYKNTVWYYFCTSVYCYYDTVGRGRSWKTKNLFVKTGESRRRTEGLWRDFSPKVFKNGIWFAILHSSYMKECFS